MVAVVNAIVCTFCHDRPVLNAAAWTALGQVRYLPCPRCGRLNLPERETSS